MNSSSAKRDMSGPILGHSPIMGDRGYMYSTIEVLSLIKKTRKTIYLHLHSQSVVSVVTKKSQGLSTKIFEFSHDLATSL